MHDLDVTLWVGKGGIDDAVLDELDTQLDDRDAVKVRILRSARSEGTVEERAETLADAVDGVVVDTRGHTAVIAR